MGRGANNRDPNLTMDAKTLQKMQQWVRKEYGLDDIKAKPQNMHKRSRWTLIIEQNGLSPDDLVWALRNTISPAQKYYIQWIGAWARNGKFSKVVTDHLKTSFPYVVEGNEYTFYGKKPVVK